MIQALLLDLGNVVLEIDFRRTFNHWAQSAKVDVNVLYQRWQLDEAYQAHETGNLDFETYIDALAGQLGISMPLVEWHAGWNDLFVAPFVQVQQRLQELAGTIPLYAFTNTNPTHEQAWRQRFPDALIHFDDIYVSSTIGLRKPEVAAYQWVSNAMGLDPQSILFLDDNRENIEGARASGLQAEWIQSEADVVRALVRF